METQAYKIVKHGRAQYQVLDPKGNEMFRELIPLYKAKQTVIEHQVQDRAMKDERLIAIVERISGYPREAAINYLYEVLIREDVPEMRLYMKRTSEFKKRFKYINDMNVAARAKSLTDEG